MNWYFDFVSPFAHIGLYRLRALLPDAVVQPVPVLFAALLEHHGQKGPAEIAAKRRHTYRWSHWWAQSLGIPFRYPAAHPFNPLHHLRLAIAAGPTIGNVQRIFDALWTHGGDAADPAAFAALARSLGVGEDRLAAPEVKETLRRNTEQAAACGVFGVPTLEIDGELFWGADAIDFAQAFLADRAVLHNDEMRRLDHLPVAAARRTAPGR
ncbi:MAG: 2-hydroxychromene-2-carboxylate isomerase [Burkholderiales bacterium]